MVYDIAVIGLGPAGASFARLVDSRKFRVIAFDRKDASQPECWTKSCGGLLSPDALRALARFDLPIPDGVLTSPQIFSVRTLDLDSGLLRWYPRFYLNIDRSKFDLWLMSLIPDTVTVCSGAVVTSLQKAGDTYEVTWREGGIEKSILSRYVVGADGARSVVEKRCGGRGKDSLLLSLQEWYPHEGQSPFFSCVFDTCNPGSYSWSLCKGSRCVFGGAYGLRDAREAFEAQKEKLRRQGMALPEPLRREACFVRRLRRPRDICLGRGNALLIGEAAGFVSPSSLEGISGALMSAYRLSLAFRKDGSVLRNYRRETLGMRLKYTLKIAKAAVLCSPLLRRIVMRWGVASIPVEQ